MTTTVEGLQQLLAERAAKKLSDDLNRLFEPLHRTQLVGKELGWVHIQVGESKSNTISWLQQIREGLYDALINQAIDYEVKEFFMKVDNLQEQLDELRGQVQSDE